MGKIAKNTIYRSNDIVTYNLKLSILGRSTTVKIKKIPQLVWCWNYSGHCAS